MMQEDAMSLNISNNLPELDMMGPKKALSLKYNRMSTKSGELAIVNKHI